MERLTNRSDMESDDSYKNEMERFESHHPKDGVVTPKTPRQTNGDYIRSMSDEDLVNLINDPNTYGFNCGMCPLNPPYGECVLGNCHEQILDWLKQEREDKE